jgi:hypothetical protein
MALSDADEPMIAHKPEMSPIPDPTHVKIHSTFKKAGLVVSFVSSILNSFKV